jgi:hypothetical protein
VTTDPAAVTAPSAPTAGVPPATDAPARLRLAESERDILGPEARTLAAALQDPDRRGIYQHLASEIDDGAIPSPLLPDLERLLELGLQSGRFRARYGPGGATAMARLFSRTPGGVEIARRVSEANAALASLGGQALQGATFSLTGWGSYALQLKTDSYALKLTIDPTGVQADSLEVGG